MMIFCPSGWREKTYAAIPEVLILTVTALQTASADGESTVYSIVEGKSYRDALFDPVSVECILCPQCAGPEPSRIHTVIYNPPLVNA